MGGINGVESVRLRSGVEIACDTVVLAIGLVPSIALIDAMGGKRVLDGARAASAALKRLLVLSPLAAELRKEAAAAAAHAAAAAAAKRAKAAEVAAAAAAANASASESEDRSAAAAYAAAAAAGQDPFAATGEAASAPPQPLSASASVDDWASRLREVSDADALAGLNLTVDEIKQAFARRVRPESLITVTVAAD